MWHKVLLPILLTLCASPNSGYAEVKVTKIVLQKGKFFEPALNSYCQDPDGLEEMGCYCKADISVLQLDGLDDTQAQETINQALKRDIPPLCEGHEIAKVLHTVARNSSVQRECGVEYSCKIMAKTDRLLSVSCNGLSYCGGPYPNNLYHSLLIDLKSQKILGCKDIVPEAQFKTFKELVDSGEDSGNPLVVNDKCIGDWWIDKTGFHVIYGEIAPHCCQADGSDLSVSDLHSIHAYDYVLKAIKNNRYSTRWE